MSLSKPSKLKNPVHMAVSFIKQDRYTATYHAKIRQVERMVALPDVLFAIENGYHEKSKDRFDKLYNSWSYAIRGKSTDNRDLRIIVAFEEETELLIITVVVLKGRLK